MTQYNDIGTLTKRVKLLEERMMVAEGAPRLSYSSIQDGGITEYDSNGSPVARYGKQWDGTHTAASLSGPTPPSPTGLSVNAVVGGLEVVWAGTFEGLIPVPMDYSRVEIHVGMVDNFDITPNNLLSTIESPQGGVQFLALAPDTTYYVRLATRSQSGKISVGSSTVSGVPLAPSGEAVIPIPDEPTITSVTGSWAYNAQYLPKASFTVNFAGVNLDTTGAPLTPVGYELWMKKTSDADSTWGFASSSALSSFNVVGLNFDTSYSFKVRALSGVAAGDFSPVVTATVAASSVVETVPTPAAASLDTRLGLATVFWVGLTSGGGSIPPHVARVDLYASINSTAPGDFINYGDILKSRTLNMDIGSAGETVYVKLKAVSFAGVESAFSATSSIVLGAVVSGDLANLSVTAGKIAANAVTAGKINAGAIDGMIITGAIMRTAPSGQRVHIDTSGLRAYNNLEQVVTEISASTGALTAVGGSFSGTITATNGSIAGNLDLSGTLYGNNYATISGELVSRVTLRPRGLLFESFSSSWVGSRIATNIGDGVFTGMLQIAVPEDYTPSSSGGPGTVSGFNTVIHQDNLTHTHETETTTPGLHYKSQIEQSSTRPSYLNPDSTLTGVNATTTWLYQVYTDSSQTTVARAARAHLGYQGLHFTSFGSGLAQPNITTDLGMTVSSPIRLDLKAGIYGVTVTKDAANSGLLTVQGNLSVEGTSNFLGAITAPGGVGGLPTPVADSAAATKAYVDSKLDGTGGFPTLRLTSTTAATFNSTGHAFQIGTGATAMQTLMSPGVITARQSGNLQPVHFPGGLTVGVIGGDTFAATKKYVDENTHIRSLSFNYETTRWADYGGGYSPVKVFASGDQIVTVTGMFKFIGSTPLAATTAAQTIGNVWTGYRPTARVLYIGMGYNGSAYAPVRIDVTTAGTLTAGWITAAPWNSATWVTLFGLSYETTDTMSG